MRVQKLFVMGLLCGISLMAVRSAEADLVTYVQTFSGSTWNNGATDMSALTTSAAAQEFQNGGPITVEEWFGGNSSITVDSTGAGTVLFGGQQRARGAMVWIDLDGQAAETYCLDVEIATFNASNNGTMVAEAKVFEATGLGASGGVETDLVATFGDPLDPAATGTGSNVSQLGSSVTLTGVGTFSAEFTLSDAGVAGEYLGVLLRRSGVSGDGSGSFRVDTVSFSEHAVPEPSSAVLLGIAGLFPMVRRRRKR